MFRAEGAGFRAWHLRSSHGLVGRERDRRLPKIVNIKGCAVEFRGDLQRGVRFEPGKSRRSTGPS